MDLSKSTYASLDALQRERKAKLICSELNNFIDLKSTLMKIIKEIQELTGAEAVSIRLHDSGDYPYYVYNGFSDAFIKKENSLCSKDPLGKRIPDPSGKGYLLDCMCGNIIRGNVDPSQSFFTENGSFFSNNTTKLLASSTEDDLQGRTRNYCNSVGYESVALVPIKAMGEQIGLIQLNDQRIGMYKKDLIDYLEMVGEQIGIAVKNSLTYTKLSETNKTKEKILALISHDIMSPYSTLLLLIDYINTSFDDLDKDQIKSQLLKIDNVSKRLHEFINKLLTWSSIQGNRMAFKPKKLDVKEIIPEIIKMNTDSADLKNISIDLIIPENLTVFCDESVIEIVLRNIISNSIKFTETGGKVTITGKGNKFMSEIIISDNGIGMSSNYLSTLFEFNPENKRIGTSKEKGSGFGLTIVNELVQKMDGKINVKSEVGRGTTFIIKLPQY
jgi:signal transduction histidine kinase